MSSAYNIDWFERWALYTPEKVALQEYETGESATYRQLNEYANQLAHIAEQEWNLKPGDRIAVIAENSIALVALLGLAQKTGIIISPLNYRLKPAELDGLLEMLKPGAVLYDEKFTEKLSSGKLLSAISHKHSLEGIYDRLGNDPKTAILTNKIIRTSKKRNIDPDSTALIIFTSGTTGKPKGSQYTHGMMFWNSINTQLRLDITAADRSVSCAPPFHTGGWNVLLTPFLHHGAFTILMKGFDASQVLNLIDKASISIWWAVPTMLKLMVQSENYESAKLSTLRYLVVGGEAMPVPLIEKWAEKGIPIRQGYGLTEVGPNVTSLNEDQAIAKKGSIGQENFYYDVRIVDEHGIDCDPNVPGEMWLSGPTVSPGYFNNDQVTSETMHGKWFKTGDIVIRDDDGFLFVVDRIKFMYISGGENVYPAEVEKALMQMEGISEIAISGVKDEKWGETGMAFIVLKPGVNLTAQEIIAKAKSLIATYKVPGHIFFVNSLPKNDAGKIDRKLLKQMASSPMGKQ